MDDEGDTSDNININMFGDSGSIERIKKDYGALRVILSKMEFCDLLQARLVCRNWKTESEFFLRRRIKAVDLNTDCRLKEYLKSDRINYPSISLDVGGLSTKVLAKCDLKEVQELLVKTTGPKRDGWVIRASDIWLGYLKNKFLKLFQQDNMNNLASLDLQLQYPITFTREESDFMRNFVNIRRLSFTQGQLWQWDLKVFEANGIGSILVSRCPSLQYLTINKLGPRYVEEAVSFNSRFAFTNITFQHLLNMLNERMESGLALPILQLQSLIHVSHANFGSFIQFVNLGLRLETLAVHIECISSKRQLNEVIIATEQLLRNSADCLNELHLDFFVDEDIIAAIEQPKITIPSLPQLQNLTIGAMMRTNRPYQFIQLPTEFPNLKQLEFVSGWDTLSVSGKVFPNLDKLLIRSFSFTNTKIPDFPPTFPNLRAIHLSIVSLREEFLRFTFTHLTSVREMIIKLPFFYYEAWDIFTGGAQQPPDHANGLEYLRMDEVENHAPGQVVDAGNVEVRPLVASLENFTNLRELFIDWAGPRNIQAITYMTQFNKMQKLDKLRINSFCINFNDYQRCLDILQGYHCNVEIKHFTLR